MKIEYKTNFAGYLPIPRAILFLLKNKILSFAQLGAYLCFISQADFDKRHKTYQGIIRSDQEIAKELNCNYTTIRSQRKALITKGLLKEENGLAIIPNFYLFELEWEKTLSKVPLVVFKDLFVNPQQDSKKIQNIIAKPQKIQPQNTTQSSNVPFKEDLGYSQKSIEDTDPDEIASGIEENKKEKESSS